MRRTVDRPMGLAAAKYFRLQMGIVVSDGFDIDPREGDPISRNRVEWKGFHNQPFASYAAANRAADQLQSLMSRKGVGFPSGYPVVRVVEVSSR